MRIALIASGTRGDIQPFLALAKGLMARGHMPTLVTHQLFRPWIQAEGVPFRDLGGDPHALMNDERFRHFLQRPNLWTFRRDLNEVVRPVFDGLLANTLAAVDDADVVVSALAYLTPTFAAEAKHKPFVGVMLQPTTRSRHYVSSLIPNAPLLSACGPLVRLWSHYLLEAGYWHMVVGGRTNRGRDQLGLPAFSLWHFFDRFYAEQAKASVLLAVSTSVIPPAPDWPSGHRATGYWFLSSRESYSPPPDLAEFLAAGDPPIYFGIGSMIDEEPERLAKVVSDASRAAGVRVLLSTGWAGLGTQSLPSYVLRIEDVPHDWLFSRVLATIHHGGAGTTAASLRAGVPTLIVPYLADQPFWGWRVRTMGVGPKAIPRGQLNTARLTAALRQMRDDRDMREAARQLGERIRSEDGVRAACLAIEEHARNSGFRLDRAY